MSLWKFGTFEQEIDFTDADFMDALEEAQEQLVIQSKETPKMRKEKRHYPRAGRLFCPVL